MSDSGYVERGIKKIEKRIWGFILAAAALMAVSFVLIGVQHELFTPTFSLYITADSAQNIVDGMPVKYKGFKIGKLKRATLDENGVVTAELSINKSHQRLIRSNSVASLSQEGMIGDFVIEIAQGSMDAEMVEEGGVLRFERTITIGDMAQEFKNQFGQIIEEVQKITRDITDPEGDIKKSLANVHTLTEQLLATRQKVDGLLETASAQVSATSSSLNETLDSVKEAVESTKRLVEDSDAAVLGANRNLEESFRKIETSLDNMVAITNNLKTASMDAPSVMQGTKQVVDSTKNIWPISGNIERPSEKSVVMDTYEKSIK